MLSAIESSAQPEGRASLRHAIAALLLRHQLTRSEVRAYCADRFDVIESRAEEELLRVGREEPIEDGEKVFCPVDLEVASWRTSAATREESRAWFRAHVALSGPFARGRRIVDTARAMRGQNPFGLDVFGWLLPQRPLPLGRSQRVSVDGEAIDVPALDAGRVLLEGDERPYDLFSGNDYLGLRVHPEVRAAIMLAARDLGAGSGGSRMLSGSSPAHRGLEHGLAGWKGAEDAVVFNTGWHANVAVMTAFAGSDTVVFSDALNHASMIDGLRLAGADVRVFRHNDVADLTRLIEEARRDPAVGPRGLDRAIVAVEGVYSMDGDVAPFAAIVDVAERNGLAVHVDEAHSALVLGEHGKGICEHAGVDPARVALQMGTLSKAFGGEGGYVLGNAKVIEALKFLARPFWFSTALPAASVAGSLASLRASQAEPDRRRRLHDNSAHVRAELAAMGYDLCGSSTWIIPVRIGDEAKTGFFQHRLKEAGILVSPVFAPAIPRGQERVRLSMSSEHTPEQIERVLAVFRDMASLIR